MEKEKNIIPDNIIDIFIKKNEHYPSFIQTKKIIKEGFFKLQEKNEVVWSNSEYDGTSLIVKETLIKYGKTEILIYLKKIDHEKIYNVNILYLLKDSESLTFLLKGLNKYFTID